MDWPLDKKRPVCPQICELICLKTARGEFETGGRLPSVRELAVSVGVNPNTVQRSFEELEEKGVLYSVRGSGWFACEDASRAEEIIKSVYREKTSAFFEDMKRLGLSEREIKKYVEEWTV